MKASEIGQDARVSGARLASRGRVLRAFRWRRPALLRGVLALAALAILGVAAALPGVHGSLQLGFVASGYLLFIVLFRSAMRRRRADWDALWDDRRPSRRPDASGPSIDTGLDAVPRSLRTQSGKEPMHFHRGILLLALLLLGPAASPAQTAEPTQSNPGEPAGDSSPDAKERERALLDRIERLERRLAEIESGKPAVAAPAPAAPAPPAAPGQVPAAGTGATNAPSAATSPEEQKPTPAEPFAFADFTWLTGNSRQKEFPLAGKVFSGEFRVDTAYTYSFNHPIDNSLGGSTEVFRHNEIQLTDLAFGGDFNWKNVRGRLLTQFGMYSQTQPRNDASPGRGQYNLDSAYRYLGEAYGGYHIDKMHGINIDAGIFLSYIGLFSFYQYDNWAYQPSYVSSNTPWYFTGVRLQFFPSDKLKIEPWIINGWQSYGKFNRAPGIGGQVLWRPNGSLSIVSNNYWGKDVLGNPDRNRIHTDDSIQVKYLDSPGSFLDKMAATLTVDVGCEYGGGVSCTGGSVTSPPQYFLGFMIYNRFWFKDDRFAVTLGGGAINNPGRYLVLLPPINGATAFSGTSYFTQNPGDGFRAWDYSVTFDYMPKDFITFRLEFNRRAANVPYFSGPGGITPTGGNQGLPGSVVPGFTPDLTKTESRITSALLVKL